MPVWVAQTVQKRTVRGATVRHDGDLVSFACHCAPLAAQPPATRAWRGPQSDTLVDALERGHRVAACRGKRLALLLSCRVRKLVAHRASRYLGWSSRQAPLAGALLPCRSAWRVTASSLECLGWPSRQAPLAGALSPELKYFVLEWLQGNHGGSWRSPGKPCRGVLQLPVHKFRVLGYPYSSTLTGAPGPGPDTVPSAVGPGPKQCTGTRGLGHAAYLSAPTAHAQNDTRQTRRRG